MSAAVEVWAELTCPFAHIGLRRLADYCDARDGEVEVHVRAWPLEWVDRPLDGDHVRAEVEAITDQLAVDLFRGEPWDRWPQTTVPAHGLVAAANQRDHRLGFELALELRSLLFEEGIDISAPTTLAEVAVRLDLEPPGDLPHPDVRADLEAGRARGVVGSPHFWVGEAGFFCPSLDLSRDEDDNLVAQVDGRGLAQFLGWIDRTSS